VSGVFFFKPLQLDMEKSSALFSNRSSVHAATAVDILTLPFRVVGQMVCNIALRIAAPFRRLPFKLSAAYSLTCLVTALMVSTIFVSGWAYVVYESELPLNYFAQTADFQGTALSGLQPTKGQFAYGAEMQRTIDDIFTNLVVSDLLWVGTLGTNSVRVVTTDMNGKILMQAGTSSFNLSAPLTQQLPDDEAGLIARVMRHRAFAGDSNYHSVGNALSFRSQSGAIVAAAPLSNDGVLFIESEPVAPNGRGFFMVVVALTIVFWLLSLIPGFIFGAVNGRRLARRLNLLSESVYCWTEGDFAEPAIKDRSGDEIGVLARRLDKLPGGLQRHVETRQKLATLEERTRVARNLHDTVKQQAFAAAMQLGAARTVLENAAKNAAASSAMVFVSNAEKLTNKVQEDLMAIIYDMKPDTMLSNTVSLTALLRECVDDWSITTGIVCEIVNGDEICTSAEVRQELMRIVQEALSNAARHSKATAVRIELGYNTDDRPLIRLVITDNGRGFDPVFTQRGLGLYSMRDRACSLASGRFSIDTSIGKGVTLTIECAAGELRVND
jgi:NarL family two-component system sensor histidine kinase LiaS